MRVVAISSEIAPWCRTGGLGDVTAALPKALTEVDPTVHITTVVPFYREAQRTLAGHGRWPKDTGLAAHQVLEGRAWHAHGLLLEESPRNSVLFVDCPPLYDHEGLYGPVRDAQGHPTSVDDAIRFSFLAIAVLQWADELFGQAPDVFHVHDWQAGLIPELLRTGFRTRYPHAASILTIHNLAYQGWFGHGRLPELGLSEPLHLLRSGIQHADRVNTVSPTYAQEIQTSELGMGMHELLAERQVVGLLNGIDTAHWDPANDPHLAASYSATSPSNRATCRQTLLKALHWPDDDQALLGLVARFDPQKGLNLVAELVPHLEALGARLVVLGSGSPEIENTFYTLSQHHAGRLALRHGFNEPYAHQLFSGCDMTLIPSLFEPCGLTQQYAMRYGSVPVVRATGGLADTVLDPGDELLLQGQGTGFVFGPATGQALIEAVRRAVQMRRAHPAAFEALAIRGMARDASWHPSARAYLDLYEQAIAAASDAD